MEPLSADVLHFFSQMRAEDGVVVEQLPKLDIESYISNYEGRSRFDRLLHIGRTCVPLSVDAIRAAIDEAKAGSDVGRYLEAWDHMRKLAPGDPDAVRDETWIREKEEINKKETARLESELRRYCNNLIKESIRMGYEDLGHHFEETGHLKEALEVYGKMRQEVSSTKHIMDCSQRLISVNLQRREWSNVLTNVGKIAGISGVEEDQAMQPYVKIVYGIGHLSLGKFAEATKNFHQTNSDAAASTYNDLVTPNDVAIYGGLTALATMDRRALQARLLDNPSFRVFLEHEPHIRKAITHFVNGRYSNCLAILAEHEPDYLLDLYLSRHVKELFGMIRRKCIVQYFAPFSCVTLESLDAVFAGKGQSIEQEVVAMIRDGSLDARIDAKSKLLIAQRADARLKMQHNALQVAHRYEEEAKERLRRINLVAAGLEVPTPRKQQGQPEGVDLAAVESLAASSA